MLYNEPQLLKHGDILSLSELFFRNVQSFHRGMQCFRGEKQGLCLIYASDSSEVSETVGGGLLNEVESGGETTRGRC